jgi:hypothetical protein
MATSAPEPRIDNFLNALPAWQTQLLSRARQLIHEAEPAVTETIKRRTWPFFVLDGNVCAFMATKDHVNILIYDPLAPDPAKIINQGQDNKTARAIQIHEHQPLNEVAFKNLIQAVAANNRAGGWRKLKQS